MTVKTASQMVQGARQRIQNLSVAEVAAEREQAGVIPGAVSAPRGMLEFWADPASPYHRLEFDPARRIILHCASGGRSALAAETLGQLGYTNVAHLDGGLKAWAEAGQPVTRGAEP